MKVKVAKHPMIPITLCLVSGIFFASHFSFWLTPFALFACLFFIGFFVYVVHQRLLNNIQPFSQLIYLGLVGSFFFVAGVLTYMRSHEKAAPLSGLQAAQVRIDEVLTNNAYNHRYYATCFTESGKHKVVLYQSKKLSALRVSDRFQGVFFFQPILSPKNPSRFDYPTFLGHKNIFYQTTLPTTITFLPQAKNLNYYLSEWRHVLMNSFSGDSFSEASRGVIYALLFGQRNDLDPEIVQSYRAVGVVHILAISGLHVGVLYAVVAFVLSRIGLSKKGVVIGSILFLVFFALLTGLSGSVVRAVMMFSIVGLGSLGKLKTSTLHMLAISMFCILIVAPNYLFDVSFQLSYAAVFSIVWLYPPLHGIIVKWPVFLRYIGQLLGVSLVAQLGVMPITLYYFGQLPLLFLLGNLVIIPLMSLVLILLLLFLPLHYLSEYVSSLLADGIHQLITWGDRYVFYLAHIKNSVVSGLYPTFVQVLIGSAAVVLLGFIFRKWHFKSVLVFGLLMLFLQLTTLFQVYADYTTQEIVVFYDYRYVSISTYFKGKVNVYSNSQAPSKLKYSTDYAQLRGEKNIPFDVLHNYLPLPQRIEIIDSTGLYTSYVADVTVLCYNPDFDFERFLSEKHPKLLVFHPSNSKWRIKYWQQVCEQKNIPFYNMYEKGYLRMRL